MNEDKVKFSKLGLLCIDPYAPVPEILEVLNKHGITLKYIDKVFENVKEAAEIRTVVYSPSALAKHAQKFISKRNEILAPFVKEYQDADKPKAISAERKSEIKINKVASEMCEILANENIPVGDVARICEILTQKAKLLSVTGKLNEIN